MKTKIQYFATNAKAIENGSFVRVSPHGIARYINGDFCGYIDEIPKTYADKPMVEFDSKTARDLLPASMK